MKIAFVMAGFGPYRVPFWNALAEHTDLTVILLSKVERGRSWEVDLTSVEAQVIILNGTQFFVRQMDWALNFSYGQVKKALTSVDPDVVIIGGWDSPGYWAARAWAVQHKKPTVFWSESTLLSTRAKNVVLLKWVKSRFLRVFDSFYATSSLSADYLATLGVEPASIVLGLNVPDIDRFDNWRRASDSEEPVLLYVGQLIKRKGLLTLFSSLAALLELRWRLVIVGEGTLKKKLLAIAKGSGFAERVEFRGYVQQQELPNVYRNADILLLPSFNEVWGMVIHEALLSGVYVVGSNRAASVLALIHEGENGEVVLPDDSNSIVHGVRQALVGHPHDRWKIRDSVKHVTVRDEAHKLLEAVEGAVARSVTGP